MSTFTSSGDQPGVVLVRAGIRHDAPTTQYVITLSGVLEFTTRGGEVFTIEPGDVLVAMDTTGTGHKWRLINDEPWKRAYVMFEAGIDTHFLPDEKTPTA